MRFFKVFVDCFVFVGDFSLEEVLIDEYEVGYTLARNLDLITVKVRMLGVRFDVAIVKGKVVVLVVVVGFGKLVFFDVVEDIGVLLDVGAMIEGFVFYEDFACLLV